MLSSAYDDDGYLREPCGDATGGEGRKFGPEGVKKWASDSMFGMLVLAYVPCRYHKDPKKPELECVEFNNRSISGYDPKAPYVAMAGSNLANNKLKFCHFIDNAEGNISMMGMMWSAMTKRFPKEYADVVAEPDPNPAGKA